MTNEQIMKTIKPLIGLTIDKNRIHLESKQLTKTIEKILSYNESFKVKTYSSEFNVDICRSSTEDCSVEIVSSYDDTILSHTFSKGLYNKIYKIELIDTDSIDTKAYYIVFIKNQRNYYYDFKANAFLELGAYSQELKNTISNISQIPPIAYDEFMKDTDEFKIVCFLFGCNIKSNLGKFKITSQKNNIIINCTDNFIIEDSNGYIIFKSKVNGLHKFYITLKFPMSNIVRGDVFE